MDELIYNLLLTGEQGLTVFGTLRYRFTGPLAGTGDSETLAASYPPRQLGVVTVVPVPVAGTLSVPLLTGFGRVPIAGVVLVTPAAGLLTVFVSDDPARRLLLQCNDIGTNRIAGGLLWRPRDPAELVFSLLGTRLLLPF
ncbi:MAG: hypothetical protein ABW069_04555 [Duganella sp.]